EGSAASQSIRLDLDQTAVVVVGEDCSSPPLAFSVHGVAVRTLRRNEIGVVGVSVDVVLLEQVSTQAKERVRCLPAAERAGGVGRQLLLPGGAAAVVAYRVRAALAHATSS